VDYFQERLNELNELCCDRIDDLLIRLGVEYKRIGRRIVGCCPLHNSDNNSGWNLYDSGNSRRGNYVCYSAQCEKKFGNNIIGLTRGILTRKSRGDISFNTSVLYLCEFLGYKSLQEIPLPDKQTLKRRKDDSIYTRLNVVPEHEVKGWARSQIRSKLEIPAPYYLARGYSREILDKYDIGYSAKLNKVIVPCYDNDYKRCIGWMERAIDGGLPKWKCSDGFEKSNYLYNYWFARERLYSKSNREDTIVIVEGIGDVLRLEQCGIHNSIALLGINLSNCQQSIIEMSRALNLIMLLDNDAAGIIASEQIKKKLGRQFRLYFLNEKIQGGKDIGECLNTDEITNEIKQIIITIKNKYNYDKT